MNRTVKMNRNCVNESELWNESKLWKLWNEQKCKELWKLWKLWDDLQNSDDDWTAMNKKLKYSIAYPKKLFSEARAPQEMWKKTFSQFS